MPAIPIYDNRENDMKVRELMDILMTVDLDAEVIATPSCCCGCNPGEVEADCVEVDTEKNTVFIDGTLNPE